MWNKEIGCQSKIDYKLQNSRYMRDDMEWVRNSKELVAPV